MPCRTDGYPMWSSSNHIRLVKFLQEVLGTKEKFRTVEEDDLTRMLCSWMKEHPRVKVSKELGQWWERHQKWDTERKRCEKTAKSIQSKLTPEELEFIKERGSFYL